MVCFAQQPGGGQAIMQMLILIVPIFVLFYFLLIRPQKKKESERKAMVAALKKNDEVVTVGGIHGVITGLKDEEVTLKVDESTNVKLRMSRSAISRVVRVSGLAGEET